MKKFFALVLALVMAMSLTTVAWGATTVTDEATLKAALLANQDVVFANDITVTATTVGSQLVGIEVPAGVTVDGNGYTLTVDGAYDSAGGTHCAVHFHGGTLKNITIVGGNRCLYVTNVQEDIILDKVVLVTEGSYGINVNDGDAPLVELKATNSVFSGWNSYGTAVTKATFENCEFVWNTAGTYAVLRPYNDTVVEDCNFADGAEISTDELVAGETVELENVTVDGEPVTAANLSTLLGTAHTDVAVTSVATTSYNVYDANGNLVKANTTYAEVDGTPVNQLGFGEVDYFTIADMAGKFVEVSKAEKADADYYLTLVGQSDARIYLKEVASTDYVVAKKFTNIGTACDQLNVNKKYDYYVYVDPTDDEDYYFVACGLTTGADFAVMVGGELIQVKDASAQDLNYHVWQIDAVNADHEVTDISCKLCKTAAKVYESKLAAPKGAWEDPTYGWIALVAPTASTTPSTDKVQSAETFDAGIAMYVGMSVMAAAGSAVVLKKKD